MTDSLRRGDRLADRIRLHRQVDKRPVLVIEGPSDRMLINRLMPSAVALFEAGTRDAVIEVAGGVSGLDRVGCVLDRDFDDAVAAAEARGLPVFPYDDADLEAMLWWSPALDDVVAEMGSQTKVRRFGGMQAVRDRCVIIISPLERL